MRWVPFLILTWLLVLVQTTVGRIFMFELSSIGTVGPDLAAALAVFVALYVRSATDAVIAACVLGFALDITTAGGPGSAAVIGPMPIAYALAARALVVIREAFFRERHITRALLTLGFCLLSHVLWVTLQSLLAYRQTSLAEYGRMLVQAAAVSAYSALVAPVLLLAFSRCRNWLIAAPAGRSRRGR